MQVNELIARRETGLQRVIGNSQLEVTGVSPLDKAKAGHLTFAGPAVPPERLQGRGEALSQSAIVCTSALAAQLDENAFGALLIADNPRLAFMRAVALIVPASRPAAGIHPTADVHPTARIDPSASVGAYCVVGPECVVGAETVLHPHVVLYFGTKIGCRVIINSGTVIGADGFGYERNEAGELEKFPHVGGVTIEDEVEIGSNTSIDRGTLGDTILKRRARVDNQIHIAHNVVVGEDAAVIAQAMIGGSVVLGARSWVAPAAIIIDRVSVGEGATVGLGAVVTKPVEDGQVVMGSPAQPAGEYKAMREAIKKLGDPR